MNNGMCVCFNANPLHYYIFVHASLGQRMLRGDVYLYLCTHRSYIKLHVCVLLFYRVCCMWNDDEGKVEVEFRFRDIATSIYRHL